MIRDDPEIDAPEGWVTNECRFSGNFKLIAEFEQKETGVKVKIRPYKSYTDQPGFCNCHRVFLVRPEDGVEEVAEGFEVEHADEAEAVAIETMEETSSSQ
jgi:hypothetical protein